jgi:hypothetical protein
VKIITIKKKDNRIYEGYEETRFAIADDNGKIIDDAQGYGYTTEQKAHKAAWYKFEGGKQKKEAEENKRRCFFKKHHGLEQYIYNIFENNFKEIARGEVTDQDILDDIKKKFDIDMPKKYLCD